MVVAPADPSRPRRTRWLIAGVIALLPAAGLVLGVYPAGPLVGALFLVGAWVSLVATGAMLFRAGEVLGVPDDELLVMTAERRSELEREKKLVLKAIKEIEFDQQMGKIDARDAFQITSGYRTRALEILRELDAGDLDYGARIEKELAARVRKAMKSSGEERIGKLAEPTPALALPEPAPEPAPADEVKVARAIVTLTCSACQTQNDPDAVFCKKCGARFAR
jgi:ribosomal protein L40E